MPKKARSALSLKFLPALVLCVASTIFGVSSSFAAPITYTEQAKASGSLGGVPFTNAVVVISMTADTSTAGSSENPRTLADGTPVAQYDVSLNVAGTEATFIQSGNTIVQAETLRLGLSDFFVGFQEGLGFGGGTILATGTTFPYDLTTPVSVTGQGLIGLGFILPDGSVGFPTSAGALNLRGPVATSTFTATVSGDPHFTTFSGIHYDYQGLGDFTLADSTVPGDQFDVQIRTESYANGTTTISKAAATLCNHAITFDVNHASAGGSLVWLDGHPSSLSAVNPRLTLGGCELIELSSESYEAIWNTGEILYVTDAGTYLNISSSLSWIDQLGSVEGLLSSDLNPDLWRVTAATSLLDPIPEPGTLTLLASALAGLGIIRHRVRSQHLVVSLTPDIPVKSRIAAFWNIL
jgi:hypothetical protein